LPNELKIEDFYKMSKKEKADLDFLKDLNEIKKLDKAVRKIVEEFLGSEEDLQDKVLFNKKLQN